MMIRANDSILDFNDFVEVDKNIKLFENLDETNGDFAYAFVIPATSHNVKVLGFPLPDSKDNPAYRFIESEIIGNDGVSLYKGNIVVERLTRAGLECSFYSGNNNWFAMLEGPLQGDYLDVYNQVLNRTRIEATWGATEGLIYTLIDSGILPKRRVPFLKISDFVGSIFVKTVFAKIFSIAGIKLKGELFNDPIFNSLITCNNKFNEDEINQRSGYALKTGTEIQPPFTTVRVLFEDMTTHPYFNGGNMYIESGATYFEADVRMLARVEVVLNITGASDFQWFTLDKNVGGVMHIFRSSDGSTGTIKGTVDVELGAGDQISILTGLFITSILPGSTFKVTPLFIWYTSGKSLVPNWTKREFVNEVLKPFNTIVSFDPYSKELTIDLFEKVKYKQADDISDFISSIEFDYSEVSQSFGQKNYLTYKESPDDELEGYSGEVRYGAGEIDVDNENIQDTNTLLTSDFSSPLTYINTNFKASLERVNFIEEVADGAIDFTAIADSPSNDLVRFTIPPNTDIEINDRYNVGDIIRVTESQGIDFRGDWEVFDVGDGWVEFFGLLYDVTNVVATTGKMERIRPVYGSSDESYLFVNAGLLSVNQFSDLNTFYFEQNAYTQMQFSFFNLLSNGKHVNDLFKQSLKFAPVDNPVDYQTTMIDNYWKTTSLVMNDPVKAIASAYFPKKFFFNLTYLKPVVIKYDTSSSMWFISKVSGYKGSEYECEVELIKLS